MPDEPVDRRQLLRNVMLAVLTWGSVIAVGSLLFGLDPTNGEVRFSPNFWRGMIVEACVLGFVGVWWWLARLPR